VRLKDGARVGRLWWKKRAPDLGLEVEAAKRGDSNTWGSVGGGKMHLFVEPYCW